MRHRKKYYEDLKDTQLYKDLLNQDMSIKMSME